MAEGGESGHEIAIDEPLARRLLAAQFPPWAELPLEPVASAGTDNAIFRLGAEMCLRLPRVGRAAGQVEKERRWLPVLNPLPLAIPTPLGRGRPGEGYPWNWSIYAWLEGEAATPERLADPDEAAVDIARFITALQRIDAAGGPPSGPHNEFRGVPLVQRDALTREAIDSLSDLYDRAALTAAWEAALKASAWPGPPVWIHGDIQSGNLLAQQGRITGVIDFGLMGLGDPACDLMVAWSLLPATSRPVFRAALDLDDATWLRGRGWALSVALIALAYYRDSNRSLAAMSRRTIDEVLAEIEQSGV